MDKVLSVLSFGLSKPSIDKNFMEKKYQLLSENSIHDMSQLVLSEFLNEDEYMAEIIQSFDYPDQLKIAIDSYVYMYKQNISKKGMPKRISNDTERI